MIHQAFHQIRQKARAVLKWLLLIMPLAVCVGSACAFFLWSLDRATEARFSHPWLLYLLPVGGMAVGFLYHWLGRAAEGGNNLILDEIHQPGRGVPRRMAPLILISTVLTHLFGGSAGREGTAVQMGGSIASGLARLIPLRAHDCRILLMAGIAAGFGAVFGTPLAGAVFAMEVLMIGHMRYDALVPCLMASIGADWVCQAWWGIHHTPYHVTYMRDAMVPAHLFHLDLWLLLKVTLAAVAFGLGSALFATLSHGTSAIFRRLCPYAPFRPALGGLVIIGLVYVTGTHQYLGLGATSPHEGDLTISSLFTTTEVHPWAWVWKLLFTVVTLGAGFKGGEVTPLFFIGAALGNVLAGLLGAPLDLFAALGFVAIFAGATNTPLACTLMGIELFGAANGVYLAVACFVAYLCSGHSGIYPSQRLGVPKNRHDRLLAPMGLGDWRRRRRSKAVAPPQKMRH